MTPNINYTLRHDLCTGCGICEAACPSSAITTIVEKGKFIPRIDSDKCNNSKGCHRCYDVCPGLGVDLPDVAKETFVDEGTQEEKTCGRYLKCFAGYSTDYEVRFHSASGGMVSQFLVWLLEKGKIDGAVVTRFDKHNPLLVESFIATTKEEIFASRGSRYAPVSLHSAVKALKKAEGGRYVVVGLPCHIQGMRKLMAADRKLKEKIAGLFAVFCSGGRSFYMTEFIFKERGINKDSLSYFQYRDDGCLGKMVVKFPAEEGGSIQKTGEYSECFVENGQTVFKEHYQSFYHPLKFFFLPQRCLYCIDHYGELGDVCFGDIHVKPYSDDKIGVNSIIVRRQKWLGLLNECYKDGAIALEEIPFKPISDSQPMSFIKKGRNGAFINIKKKLGGKVPEYDVDYLRKPSIRDWLNYMEKRFQQFLGSHKGLWPLVTRMKAKVKIY